MARFVSLTVLALLSAFAATATAAPATVPTTAPTTAPAEGFDLREWAVFVLDGSQNTLNPDGLVTSTFPSFVTSRRDASDPPSHEAAPVGIIRLIGSSEKSVDVKIEQAGGNFMSSWPQAEKRSKQLLWRNLTLAAGTPAGKVLEPVPDNHWFQSLRNTESAYLSLERGAAERFLLYDVEMPYPSPLTVSVGKDHSIGVANTGHAPLHNIVFYQPIGASWRQGTIDDLAAPAGSATPATRPGTMPATVPASVFADTAGTTLPSTAPTTAATAPTTTPATQPTTQPVTLIPVTMTATPTTGPSELTDSWKPVLQKLGVSEADTGVMVSVLASALRDSHKLTVIYLMDDAEFDRLLPLEVVPEPRSIKRVGIVIVKNADPIAGSDIDDLITQLGDPAWSKRDEAFKSLAKIGAVATPKLRDAAKSKDIEVVWRAEKLLAMAEGGKPANH